MLTKILISGVAGCILPDGGTRWIARELERSTGRDIAA